MEAGELIDDIDFEAITKIRKPDFLSLNAKRLEKLNKFNESFLCCSQMNTLMKSSSDFIKSDPDSFFQTVKNLPDTIKSILGRTKNHQIIKSPDFTPVFLFGFRRSGTNLLDTILPSHLKNCSS